MKLEICRLESDPKINVPFSLSIVLEKSICRHAMCVRFFLAETSTVFTTEVPGAHDLNVGVL